MVFTYNIIKLCIQSQITFASNASAEAGAFIATLPDAFLDTIAAEAMKALGDDTCIGAIMETNGALEVLLHKVVEGFNSYT